MIETTKKAFYATVGAPVLTAKKVNEKFQEMTSRLRDTDLKAEFEAWAAEGEKLIERFGDQPVIEEWTSRLDDIHMPAQVSKLREQLDEMVDNFRKSFRPEEAVTVPVEEEKPAKKPAAKKPAAKASAKKPAASTKKPAASAKKPAAKKATATKSAASKSTAAKSAGSKTTKKA